jgi:hypothetical protein
LVLYTIHYNLKIAALLEDQEYKKLNNNPTNALEQKTDLLKRSSVSEEVYQQLTAEFKTSRALHVPKDPKGGVPLRFTVSIIGAPTY